MSGFESMFSNSRVPYTRAPSEDFDEKDTTPTRPERGLWSRPLLFISCGLLLVSISINIYAFIHIQRHTNLDQICSTYTSNYKSPVSEEIDIKYETVTFNGSFLQETIYRQQPSPEVDQAWKDIGADYELIRVPEDRADDFGIPKGQAKIPERLGGGYPVIVETFHHLHCLNVLRKNLWFNHEYYAAQGDESVHASAAVVRLHVGHCLDILRQQLMCTADVNVFGQWWIEGREGPFVDFNTQHTCKNFEDVRRWTERRLLSGKVEVERRPGDVILADIP